MPKTYLKCNQLGNKKRIIIDKFIGTVKEFRTCLFVSRRMGCRISYTARVVNTFKNCS